MHHEKAGEILHRYLGSLNLCRRQLSIDHDFAFSCCLAGENVKSDFRSNEVAYRVYNYILENTGRCPSIIVSMPHRRWLDVNRYDDDGLATFGEEEMKKVYTQYHDGLTELVTDVGGRPGILFDIHGHAKKDWTMIGKLKSTFFESLNTLMVAFISLALNALIIQWYFNSFKPCVPFMGHRQTE